MRRDDAARRAEQRAVGPHGLDADDVEPCARDDAPAQGVGERDLVHQLTAGGVDEAGGRLHAGEHGGGDQSARRLGEGAMEADDVRPAEKLVDAHELGRRIGLGRARGGDDPHAEGGADASDGASDLAPAHHAQRAAFEVGDGPAQEAEVA